MCAIFQLWFCNILLSQYLSFYHLWPLRGSRLFHILHWAVVMSHSYFVCASFAVWRHSAAGICNCKVKAIIYWPIRHKNGCNLMRHSPFPSYHTSISLLHFMNSYQDLPLHSALAGQQSRFCSFCAWHCWRRWWPWQFYVSTNAFLFAGDLKLLNNIRLTSSWGAISGSAENRQPCKSGIFPYCGTLVLFLKWWG